MTGTSPQRFSSAVTIPSVLGLRGPGLHPPSPVGHNPFSDPWIRPKLLECVCTQCQTVEVGGRVGDKILFFLCSGGRWTSGGPPRTPTDGAWVEDDPVSPGNTDFGQLGVHSVAPLYTREQKESWDTRGPGLFHVYLYNKNGLNSPYLTFMLWSVLVVIRHAHTRAHTHTAPQSPPELRPTVDKTPHPGLSEISPMWESLFEWDGVGR